MNLKRRDERRQRHRGEQPTRWSDILQAAALALAVTLLVITLLIPSEGSIPDGASAPLAAGWCLLLVVWAASLFLSAEPIVRIGWTEIAGVAFVGWYSLAAVLSLGETNGRFALNAHWLVLSYGIAVFLLRQLIHSLALVRSLLAGMIWLATLLAALGLYQYFYSMPRQREEYERTVAAQTAAQPASGETAKSPLRELFDNRVRSVEPIGTFALTNSLAGFLAPWLIATLAVCLACGDWSRHRSFLMGMAGCLLLLSACLILTKSRSAFLATAIGLVLITLYGRGNGLWPGWRPDWRLPAAAAGIAVLLGLGAVFLGGLDWEVLSEAPRSVLYRLEYWQATARMIADYPLLGCGPGNFQEVYATYKLPQASETVADPHNFLLEIWATAGTPALLLFVLLVVAFIYDLLNAKPPRRTFSEPLAPAFELVFGGALLGLLVGPWISAALGLPLVSLPVVWLLGGLLLLAAWWTVRPWCTTGNVSLPALIIPQVVLAINLLAAGAFVFPGVISTLLVLAPAALVFVELSAAANWQSYQGLRDDSAALPLAIRLPHLVSGAVLCASALLTVVCLYTAYYPVFQGQSALAEALYALEQRRYADAEPQAIVAARADSLSPEPWRLLSELRLARWEARRQASDWDSFLQAADTFQALNPRHHLAWFERGKWLLVAWKKDDNRDRLDQALAAFRQAVKHFPNKALYHAQLAWTLHLAGDDENARLAAENAWKLDQQMPHREQRLDRQHVIDPANTPNSPGLERSETAEQTVQSLRTAPVEKAP